MKYLNLVMMMLMMTSCYTSQKAKKDLFKIKDTHPEVLLKYIHENYPCITSKVDTFVSFDTSYEFIEIQCPEIQNSQVIDTCYLTNYVKSVKVVKKKVAVPEKTYTIYRFIRDSAEIGQCELLLKFATDDKNKLINKLDKKTTFIWLFLVLFLLSAIINILFITTKK